MPFTRKENKWFLEGKEVKELKTILWLNAMEIPLSWENVVVSSDSKVKVLAIGRTTTKNWQYRFNKDYFSFLNREKFEKLKVFSSQIGRFRQKIADGMIKGDPFSYICRIEDLTCIRIGSRIREVDQVDGREYGLTTLLKRHVEIKGDKVTFAFNGFEGKKVVYEIFDKEVANWLREQQSLAKNEDDPLFPGMNEKNVTKWIRNKTENKTVNFYDFRIFYANVKAKEILTPYAGKVLDKKQKTEIVKNVLDEVSRFLNNTPKIAQSGYIDFMAWEIIGGIDEI